MPTKTPCDVDRPDGRQASGITPGKGDAWPQGSAAWISALLPQADPTCESHGPVEATRDAWVRYLAPEGPVESGLVDAIARLSIALEDADLFVAKQTEHRSSAARREETVRRFEEASELGRRLLLASPKPKETGRDPSTEKLPPDPATLVLRLEQTTEGCRWLMARWGELRTLLELHATWSWAESYTFCQLLGKRPMSASIDLELNGAVRAWNVLEAGEGTRFWEHTRESASAFEPAFSTRVPWRDLTEGPADAAGARDFLMTIVVRETERLAVILESRMREAELESADLAARTSFDDTVGFERFRRYRVSLVREREKTFEILRRLRLDREESEKKAEARGKTPPPTAELLQMIRMLEQDLVAQLRAEGQEIDERLEPDESDLDLDLDDRESTRGNPADGARDWTPRDLQRPETRAEASTEPHAPDAQLTDPWAKPDRLTSGP